MAAFTNQATLTYRNSVRNSNIVSGEVVQVLSADKNAVRDTYAPGETITYTVSLVNAGTTPYNNLTVTDNLGAYTVGTLTPVTVVPMTYTDGSVLVFVNGVLQAAPAVTAGPPLVISGINVPAGGNTVLVYRATLNEYAPLGTGAQVQNTATISGAGISTPLTATETVTAAQGADLAITKSLFPATVVENGQLTYTFTIQNYGTAASVATDEVFVSDTFLPILTDLTVLLNGAPLAVTTDYTYDESTGVFSTVPGRIVVPAATYAQDPATGIWTVDPGVATLTVTGTV